MILFLITIKYFALVSIGCAAEHIASLDAQNVSFKRLRHQSKMVKPSLKITNYHVRSTVMSRYALTTVESTIWNQLHLTKEAVFEVDLPPSAFISNFTITSDGKVHVAQVKERSAAKKFYDAAKKHGNIAGLVATKERETEKFRLLVSVPPAIRMSFSLSYEELLTRRLGHYELALGLRPGQPVQNLSVDITVAEQSGISFVKVLPLRTTRLLSSAVQAEAEAPPSTQVQQSVHCAHIHYSPTLEQQRSLSTKGLNADFVIQYDVELKDLMGDIQVHDGYFVHYFAPRGLPVVPKDVIFVIDISGSMIGAKIKQTKTAMSTILDELREGDYFNLITFSDKVHTWKKGRTVQATKQNIQEAREFVRKIAAEGWTNINAALLSAAQLVHPSSSSSSTPHRVPMIICLTDGEATIGETAQDVILRNAKSALGPISLFGLAFGDDADFSLLKRLALENRGIARMVYEDADAALQLKGFYDEVASPLLSDVQLSYLEDQAYDVTRAFFPNYFQGSELVVTGKIKSGVQELKVSLTAHDSKQKLKVESDHGLAKTERNETTPFLGCMGDLEGIDSFMQRLWAYFTIKELLLAKINSTDSLVQRLLTEKATNLSLKYNFVTPVTSLVVVKPNTDEYPTSVSSTSKPARPVTSATAGVNSTVTQTLSANHKNVSVAAAENKKSKSILTPKIDKLPLTKTPRLHVPPSGLHTTGQPTNTVSPGKNTPPSSPKSTTTSPSPSKTISSKISSKAFTTITSTMRSLLSSTRTSPPPTKVFTALRSTIGSTTSSLPTKTMTKPSSIRPQVLVAGKLTPSLDSENSTDETPSLQDLGVQADSLYRPKPADPDLDMNMGLDIPTLLSATFGPMPGITDARKPWEASGILDVSTAIHFETKNSDDVRDYDVTYDYDYTVLYDLHSSAEAAAPDNPSSVFSSSVDGDPHFVVKLPKVHQNLCFTVEGRPNDVLRLLEDPGNGIIVDGHLMLAPAKHGAENHTRTFFDKITIKSAKGGINVTLMMDFVVVKGEGLNRLPTNQQGSVAYLDLKIVLDGHQNCWIDFGKGILFLVVFHRYSHPRYFQMEHLGFYIIDGEGLSSLTEGLVGQFQHSYMEVVRITDSHAAGFHHAQTSKNSLAMGLLKKGNQHIPVTLQDKTPKNTPSKHVLAQCWVVPRVEVERLLGHSYQSYLVNHL